MLPVAGILIGGAMTATSWPDDVRLASCAAGTVRTRRPWPSACCPATRRELCRPSAGQALVPALDQTRTVGLVALPDAFVGVLLGAGTALQAGATQLLILVALLAVEAIAVAVTVELVARGALRPPDPISGPRPTTGRGR